MFTDQYMTCTVKAFAYLIKASSNPMIVVWSMLPSFMTSELSHVLEEYPLEP